jgi:hypothetical protein
MNEVFGEGSFIAQIILGKAFAPVNLKSIFLNNTITSFVIVKKLTL